MPRLQVVAAGNCRANRLSVSPVAHPESALGLSTPLNRSANGLRHGPMDGRVRQPRDLECMSS